MCLSFCILDSRPLQNGDIVNCDVSCYVDGVHGDCSAMFTVGEVDEVAEKLIRTCRQSLDLAISICKPDVPINKIGATIEDYVNKQGFSVQRNFVI